ncbi:MAG: hypothetical protein IT258_10785 [Saprospiraceae bacterium]|nr:hypothetical protein [Saprospiraceae bacterium]
MKSLWLRLKRNLPIWLLFYFLYSLPVLFSSLSFEFGPLGVGSQALDHVGGQSWWYPTLFWMLGHIPDSFQFATIAWAVYKSVLVLRDWWRQRGVGVSAM